MRALHPPAFNHLKSEMCPIASLDDRYWARSGRSQACPLLGDERKRNFGTFRSVDDPKLT